MAYNHLLSLFQGDPVPYSGLWGHQVQTQCTDIHVGKTHKHFLKKKKGHSLEVTTDVAVVYPSAGKIAILEYGEAHSNGNG